MCLASSKKVANSELELGHPVVAILLTALCFYYAGLTAAQFQETLKHLSRLDDPSHEWLAIASQLPPTLQSWSAVNVEDDSQYVD